MALPAEVIDSPRVPRIGHLVAHARSEVERPSVSELGVQLAREAEQDVPLLAPVIRPVARGVLDHPHAHRPELTCAPARLARITRVSRRFDGAPVGRTEGNVLHLHGRAGYRGED